MFLVIFSLALSFTFLLNYFFFLRALFFTFLSLLIGLCLVLRFAFLFLLRLFSLFYLCKMACVWYYHFLVCFYCVGFYLFVVSSCLFYHYLSYLMIDRVASLESSYHVKVLDYALFSVMAYRQFGNRSYAHQHLR